MEEIPHDLRDLEHFCEDEWDKTAENENGLHVLDYKQKRKKKVQSISMNVFT